MRKYEYKTSAFGRMRNRMAEEKRKEKVINRVPYKTILNLSK
jgi:hypothetical protein